MSLDKRLSDLERILAQRGMDLNMLVPQSVFDDLAKIYGDGQPPEDAPCWGERGKPAEPVHMTRAEFAAETDELIAKVYGESA